MLAPPVAQDRLPHALRGKTQPLRRHYPRPSGQGGLTAPPRSRRAPQVESATTDLIQHLLCNSRSVPWGHNPVSCSPRRCGGRLDRVFSRSSRPVQATAGLTHVRTGGVVEPTDWEQVSETRAGPGRLPTIVNGGACWRPGWWAQRTCAESRSMTQGALSLSGATTVPGSWPPRWWRSRPRTVKSWRSRSRTSCRRPGRPFGRGGGPGGSVGRWAWRTTGSSGALSTAGSIDGSPRRSRIRPSASQPCTARWPPSAAAIEPTACVRVGLALPCECFSAVAVSRGSPSGPAPFPGVENEALTTFQAPR